LELVQLILQTEKNRKAVLYTYRLASLASGLKLSLLNNAQGLFISTAANSANNFRIFDITIFGYNKLDSNPSFNTGPSGPIRIVDFLLQFCKSANKLRHLLYRYKEVFIIIFLL